jgi:hypothetical protein
MKSNKTPQTRFLRRQDVTENLADYGIVQGFLEKMDPSDEKVRNALGIANRHCQVFWGLLNAVTSANGLAIPNALQVAKKLMKFPSPEMTHLLKQGLLEHGNQRGEWVITAKAIKKMNALLEEGGSPANTETVSAESIREDLSKKAPKPRKTRKPKKTRRTKPEPAATKTPKVPDRILNKTVGQIIEKLQAEKANLLQQAADVDNRIQEILKIFQK